MRRSDNGKTAVYPKGRWAVSSWILVVVGLLAWLLSGPGVTAAELSAADLKIRPNGDGKLIISGAIEGESTFGVTIMVELIPRPKNTGRVEFTPVNAELPAQRGSISVRRRLGHLDEVRVAKPVRPDVDIVQLGDPWPDQGTFTVFDTDKTNSRTLNGTVDDNGIFVGSPVTFSGALSALPVRASADAEGVWDVTLSTSRGDSSWEGAVTELSKGTVTVTVGACAIDRDCRDRDPCTVDTCEAGTCKHTRQEGACEGKKRAKDRARPGDSRTGRLER